MNPRLQVISSPQGRASSQSSNMPFNFLGGTGQLQVFEDDVIRAANAARQDGMREKDINSSLQNYLQQRAAQSRAATVAPEEEESRNGFLDFVSTVLGGAGGTAAGAAAGTAIAPGIGTVIGAILGGAGGSAAGQAGSNVIQGKNVKDRLGSEALFGSLGGAGKLFKFARGGKAALGLADDVGRVASKADDVVGTVDDIADIGKTNVDDLGRLSKSGKRLRLNARGFNTTQGKRVFGDAPTRFGASDVLNKAGLKGSARKQFEAVNGIITEYSDEAQKLLKGAKGTTKASSIVDDIARKTALSPNASDTAYKRAVENAQNLIKNVAGKKGGQLTASQIHQVKRKLGDKLSRAFAKLSSENKVLTAGEEGLLDAWEALDDSIIRLAPNAKRLTKAQSILLKSLPALDRAQTQGIGIPFTTGLNFTTPSRFLSSVQDQAGRFLEFAGGSGASKLSAPTSSFLKNVATQGIPRAILGDYAASPEPFAPEPGLAQIFTTPEVDAAIQEIQAAGIADPNQIQQILQANGLAGDLTAEDIAALTGGFPPDMAASLGQGSILDPEVGAMTPSGLAGGLYEAGLTPQIMNEIVPRQAIVEAMMEDFINTGGANLNNLITFYEFANQTGGFAPEDLESDTELSSDQQKEIGKLSSIESSLNQLTQQFELAGGGQGIGGLLQRNIFSKVPGLSSEVRVYEGLRNSLIAPLARAISGEVGVLTDRDIKRAEGLLPKVSDTPEEAQRRIQNLQQLLQERKSTVLSTPTSSGGTTDELLAGLEVLGI